MKTILSRIGRDQTARKLSWCAAFGALAVMLTQSLGDAAEPADWFHWRGPEATGVSRDKNLPTTWSPSGENVIWVNDNYGTMNTPIAMNGKLYFVTPYKPESSEEGEQVICANADTGEVIWSRSHNVFLSDAPLERVGWSSVIGDPETGRIFWLGLGCEFLCLDGESGEIVWGHSLSEEYGMLSTYGGRTNFPIVFENLVIINGVTTHWGDKAPPGHRFIGFDKESGAAVWYNSVDFKPDDTTYSTPFLTTFDGQAALVYGSGEGTVEALQPRTGKRIWRYKCSNRGIFTSPTVVDNIVYCGFHEQSSANTRIRGGLFAFDGRTSGDVTDADLIWKKEGVEIEKGQPVVIDGRLYIIDIKGKFFVLDAKTGEEIFSRKIGRKPGYVNYGDGHIYCSEGAGSYWVFDATEDGVKEIARTRVSDGAITAAPIFYRGKMYITSSAKMYCIGDATATPEADPLPEPPAESPKSEDQEIAWLQVAPVEVMLAPGQQVSYQVRAYNAKGRYLNLVDAEFSLNGGGEMTGDGAYTAPDAAEHSAVIITAKASGVEGTARARIIPPLPWSFDFDDGKVPVTWVGANYRHQPKEVSGQKVLVKRSDIPLGTRSQSWMGWTTFHDYTIQADVFSTVDQLGNKADMGLINQRYTLDLMNKAGGELQIRSWTPRLDQRFSKTIPFAWEGNTWYTLKFQSENGEGGVTLRGKVWKRDEQEPAEWQIEATDALPNTTGSPGMFGKSDLAEFYIDNVKVYDNE